MVSQPGKHMTEKQNYSFRAVKGLKVVDIWTDS